MQRLIPQLLDRIDLVVFDLAGTTLRVGDYVTGAFRQAFKESGVMLKSEEINAIRGRSKREALAILLQRHLGSQVRDKDGIGLPNLPGATAAIRFRTGCQNDIRSQENNRMAERSGRTDCLEYRH